MKQQIMSMWDHPAVYRFGNSDKPYIAGMKFLDGVGVTIEDWGCGATWAKKFVKKGKYIGIDGSPDMADVIVDLREYTSSPDCIFMRGVLEHNVDWKPVLENAVKSFQKKMCLLVFTPFQDETRVIDEGHHGLPDIGFKKSDLTDIFGMYKYTEETMETATKYETETLFYITK